MTGPQFSVVLLAHNQYHYISDAVASVLAAPSARVEVICVDDGSTDGSTELLREIAAADPRVRVVQHAHCGRPGMLRNAGLMLARGDWVSFLDADDLYDPARFTRLAAVITRASVGIDVFFHDHLVFRDGAPLSEGRVRIAGALEAKLLDICMPPATAAPADSTVHMCDGNRLGVFLLAESFVLHTSSIVVRRSMLMSRGLRYPTTTTYGEDHLFMLAAVLGSRVAYVAEVLSYYRRHVDSLTAVRTASAQGELLESMRAQVAMLERRASRVFDPRSRARARHHLLDETMHLGYLLERRGDREEAVRVYLRAASRFRTARGVVRAAKALVRRPSAEVA